jgi:Mn-dependent DtxR family transcriptional regulator
MGKEAANDGVDRDEGSERPARITRDQSLAELFMKYSGFRMDFFTLDEQLRELDDPLALKMIQEATVGELAKSLGVAPDTLAEKIQRLIDAY